MRNFFLIVLLLSQLKSECQNRIIRMNDNWTFRDASQQKWMPASIPGSVYTDLYRNQTIPNPLFGTNEYEVQWVDSTDWVYQHYFFVDDHLLNQKNIDLIFDGIDTYAEVYLNDSLLLKTDNMFVQWITSVKPLLHKGQNRLCLVFHSPIKTIDSIAHSVMPLVRPDNNRLYARKAQYQFGWDWGPKLMGAGIWKDVWMDAYSNTSAIQNIQREKDIASRYRKNDIKLIQQKDSLGTSFRFEKNGVPIYMKGANWIPASIFPGTLTRNDYKKLLTAAKEANMNMLRVWGGGIYESDDFYDLCDSLGIYVWQDLMFAGAMYPADEHFLASVKNEITCQVKRLRHHPCIVIWCGNNEIDEAWHNWGWQKQYNLHNKDSVLIWEDYKTLFQNKIPEWLKELDNSRPYIPSSPQFGWGHKESFTQGDSHYWGLWWGLEDWESFNSHTGRFVSEYGMQSMSDYETIEKSTKENELTLYSPSIVSHQKAGEGFKKINHYLNRYFIDSNILSKLSLKEYAYLTQCMQAFILRNVIATHRSHYPKNAGTLVWQLNDCWPATSWSLIDGDGKKKAAWYAVKRAYSDKATNSIDTIYREKLAKQKPEFTIKPVGENSISISSNCDTKFVYIENAAVSDNYFDLKKGETKIIVLTDHLVNNEWINQLKIYSLNEFYQKNMDR